MNKPSFSRRRFSQSLAAGCLLGWNSAGAKIPRQPATPLRAAAIQMVPKLGDVQHNLSQAERLIRRAMQGGAQWIVLPEMFTSAAAFHPAILKAIEPYEGTTLRLLKDLSRQGNVMIGGSFLARRGQRVFNTFVLVSPDGVTVTHDKDYPTYWENCYCERGNDDGVLSSPIGPVGSVLCWEFIRSGTARRLFDKVNLVVGGSCWWTLPDDADQDHPFRAANLKMLRDAPVRMARMLGVPVVHGSNAGRFEGFFSPELPDVEFNSSYLGEAMIVDARGQVLSRRAEKQGEGVVMAEIQLSDKPAPSEPIPDRFWTPQEMPLGWKDAWERWFDSGADYYKLVTQMYLRSGTVPEYTPSYMR